MYKIFHGFALVEAYQNLKKAKRLAENKSVSRFVKLAIAIVVSLVLWCLPIEIFGVEGLTVIEQTSNPQLSSSASFLRLNVLSSLN